jgi:hypothetical protein
MSEKRSVLPVPVGSNPEDLLSKEEEEHFKSKFRIHKNRKTWKGRKKPQSMLPPPPVDVKLIEEVGIINVSNLLRDQLDIEAQQALAEALKGIRTCKRKICQISEDPEEGEIVEDNAPEFMEDDDMDEAELELIDITLQELEREAKQVDPYEGSKEEVLEKQRYLELFQCPYCFEKYSQWATHSKSCIPKTFDVSALFCSNPVKKKQQKRIRSNTSTFITHNCLCGAQVTVHGLYLQ